MRTARRSSGVYTFLVALLGAGGLLVALVLVAPQLTTDGECRRVVTYEVTWDDPFVRARGVEWGRIDDLKSESGVSTPWRVTEDVECYSVVLLSAAVPRRVPDFTCRLSVDGKQRWRQADDRRTTCDAQVLV